MTKCEYRTKCRLYDNNSQACNDDYLPRGNCGIRKNEVAPLIKKDNQLEKQINVFIK